MRSHSTKFQLKEKSLDANFILSNTLHALLLFKVQRFSFQCRFRPSVSVTRPQCTWRVARGFFSLASTPARALGVFPASVAPLAARAGVSCGGRTPVAADRGRNGGSTPFGAAQRPSALRVASCMPAHARGTVVVARQARNVLPTANGPAPPRFVELAHSTKSQPD